jgi:hypothetical protein
MCLPPQSGCFQRLGIGFLRQNRHPPSSAIWPRLSPSAPLPFVEGIGSAPAYWRDGGTIDAYWEAHIDLLDPQADFQLSQA